MAYINPTISTIKNKYDTDLIVENGNCTLLGGPITIPNVTVTGTLNVIDELNVTGNLEITVSGNYDSILNITG